MTATDLGRLMFRALRLKVPLPVAGVSTNKLPYLAHLVSMHRCPILYHNDDSFVKAIDDSDLHNACFLTSQQTSNPRRMW